MQDANKLTCFAISSITQDGLHILMLDFDHKRRKEIIEYLKRMIKKYSLSDIYLIKSTNGYNAYSLDRMTIRQIIKIGNDGLFVCPDFLKFGSARGYYDLRIDKDKKLECVIDGSHKGYYPKSNVHRLFFNIIFDLDIKQDGDFDNSLKFETIQYESVKHGYYNEKGA